MQRLQRDGFLYQWYDTTTGHVLRNPGDADCSTETTPAFDNCFFISNVDNGWYASGLIVVRQALPELTPPRRQPDGADELRPLLRRPRRDALQRQPAIPGNQPTGQMFGGYYVGLPPDQGDNWTHYYHNGAFYSDPRISAYVGMGLHQMPGNVWWRSWRELPPPAPSPTASDRPRLLLAGPVADERLLADVHRPAVGPAVPGLGGRTTSTPAPT